MCCEPCHRNHEIWQNVPVAAAKKAPKTVNEPSWTFLTNHGHVLVCIAQNPDIRITEIADLVGEIGRAHV